MLYVIYIIFICYTYIYTYILNVYMLICQEMPLSTIYNIYPYHSLLIQWVGHDLYLSLSIYLSIYLSIIHILYNCIYNYIYIYISKFAKKKLLIKTPTYLPAYRWRNSCQVKSSSRINVLFIEIILLTYFTCFLK